MAKSTDDSSTPATQDAKDTKGAKDTTPAKGDTDATGSRSRLLRSGNPRRRASAQAQDLDRAEKQRVKAQRLGNPGWFTPVMLGLMLIGLLWVVTFYITNEQYPVTPWGRWNLAAGFAFILAGFAMTTRWK